MIFQHKKTEGYYQEVDRGQRIKKFHLQQQ